ncbi:MAG TPA: glycoside hydrolase family 18 protein [Bryobacteraceae bacterium]|nr:glycoside hydrolase family 18 protein [Bryobacteraceae bacterium]
MKLQSIFTVFLVTLQPLLLSSLAKAQAPKRLVAYYRATDKQNKPIYTADNIPYDELTHIIHVAVELAPANDGSISVLKGAIEPNLTGMAHAFGAVVLVSPRGGATAFSSIAGSAATRSRFAQSLMNFVTTNSYDGVDIDWEVPEAADQANCTLMMEALRQAMPSPQYQLSMAVTDSPGSRGHYDFAALNQIIDFYNVMSYDFHGPWSVYTGHNAPLFANHADPDHVQSIDDVVNTYVNTLGIPKSMLNLGMAFYGYEFPVANLWDKCNCRASVFSRKYGDYIKPRIDQNGWTSHVDSVSMAPYLTSNDPNQPGFITYDDAASTTRKVIYALQVRDLGGVFMWELAEDFDGSSQDLMDAMYTAYYNITMSMQAGESPSIVGKRVLRTPSSATFAR